jgi:hypothetical protein
MSDLQSQGAPHRNDSPEKIVEILRISSPLRRKNATEALGGGR